MSIIEMRRMMQALENAVSRVETISAKHDEIRALQSLDRLIETSEIGQSDMVMAAHEPLLIIDQAAVRTTNAHLTPGLRNSARGSSLKLPSNWKGPLLRGGAVAVLAAALFLVLDWQFGLFGRQVSNAGTTGAPGGTARQIVSAKSLLQPAVPAPPMPASPSAGLPLPTVYGIYAASKGQLYELQALPGRVPDQRVFMSTAIKTPSHTILPDGQIAFIVYRRDIATSAPDRVQVRVIAKVMRGMTFDAAGKANTLPLEDQWTIRGTSYDLRVAPVNENTEMLMIRPENSGFVFHAGRYGLVVKGQAYDFTVAGPITEAAHCLERIEAANGAFYSECRNP
jgi:hypothetical protein